ncbi:MAG TPA: ATP-binding protein [Burkholderiaceae bacterium]|nr:ATP-binding protein [Burkholderiaceae bacterium]
MLGPLAVAAITLVAISVGGFHALSAARAYVGGESLWSKSRSRAIAFLRTQPSADCGRLDKLLEVPLGDHEARLALDASPPDLEGATAGFLRGGNAAADIDGMIHLYLNFRSMPPVHDAITEWQLGDALIEQLRLLGQRVCTQAELDPRPAAMGALMGELDRLESELAAAETRFLNALGRASRIVETTLTIASLVLALGLALGGAGFAMASLRTRFAQQRALEDVNKRWQLAADAANIGLYVWHPDSDSVELDARARRICGLADGARNAGGNSNHASDATLAEPPRPVPRAEVDALIHPDDRERIAGLKRSSGREGEPLRSRYRLMRADGQVRHIESIGAVREPDVSKKKRPTDSPQVIGLLRDVTDEVTRASVQLEKEAAERTARARIEFLSRLSHELRTPLNAILGFAQVIEMDTDEPLTPRQAERMKLLLDSGWHLLHLVDDVLDITSIDSGQLAVRTEPTDLRAVVDASLALIEPERRSFEIEARNELPERLAPVLADPRRLQQVLVNLFSNACKYNRRRGRLTISCRDLGHRLCLDIADEGAGLTAAEMTELFQPFKRLTKTRDVPGTGLGLAVVKMLVGQMDGSVEVASEPGLGSRFTVCLPRVQQPIELAS